MPPKKGALIDGQQKLTFLFSDTSGKQLEVTKDVESECEVQGHSRSSVQCVGNSNTGNSCTSRKSAGRFFKPQREKFDWLSYDESENSMFCQVCMERNKKNGMTENAKCRNFQHSTLVMHAALPEHQMALQTEEFEEYEIKEIGVLYMYDYYRSSKTSTWLEDGLQKEKTSQPVINPDGTKEELQLLKKVVVTEQYPKESMWKLWNLIVTYHHADFPNLQ